MLPALATTAEATALGITASEPALLRASTRVRSFTGQQLSADESTVTLRGPIDRLPQRPVTAVTSVQDEDGNDVEYTLGAAGVLAIDAHCEVTVIYSHGYAEGTFPDELVELVATVASRLEQVDPSLAAGVVQEQSGSVSQTFGVDAWKGLSSLTSEEKAVLSRLFPKLPRTLVMRP
jgi:DNA-binding NarL/FixJ family response regulator